MNSTVEQINAAIIAGNFTNDQLTSIVDAVKFARARLGAQTKRELRIGSVVTWNSVRRGLQGRGVVEKISQKNVVVREGTLLWKVPANMLEVA